MAHMMKHSKAGCGHMFSHYDRKAESISNENIDKTKTWENYNLATHQQMEQGDFVRQRCSEVYCLNRKDVNVMCSWVLTVPKYLPEEEHERFFKASYSFMEKRYGKENVVSAYVHKDEIQPHMHFAFVPVVYDKKKERFKVSAKEAVDRYDLQTFHQDLAKHLQNNLGHEVSVLNDATKEGNKSIEELKKQSATERLQEVQAKACKIVSEAQERAQGTNDSLVAIRAEYEAKKAYVREADRIAEVSVMYPEEVKVTEKGLIHKQKYVTVPAEMWEAKHISANEKNYLQKANEELDRNIQKFSNTASAQNIAKLSKKVNELEQRNVTLSTQNRSLEQRLEKAEKDARGIMDRLNKTLSKLPESVSQAFINAWKTLERGKSNDRQR